MFMCYWNETNLYIANTKKKAPILNLKLISGSANSCVCFVFQILLICTVSVGVSMCAKHAMRVPYPKSNTIIYPPNASIHYNYTQYANYTGFNLDTFRNNLGG